jgi:hypothetical protein
VDEVFEATGTIGKITKFPIVPVSGDWSRPFGWLKEAMLAEGNIGPAELELFAVADDPGRNPQDYQDRPRRNVAKVRRLAQRGRVVARIDAGRCRVGAIATSALGRRTGATPEPRWNKGVQKFWTPVLAFFV